MSWSYRIIRHTDGHYALHEVFYGEDGEPNGMTVQPVSFAADAEDGAEGVVEALRMALKDASEREPLPEERFSSGA